MSDPTDYQARAQALVDQMTLDEKIGIVTGQGGVQYFPTLPAANERSLGGDGFVPGIPRLGIPDLQITGSGLGISDVMLKRSGPTTAMPSTIAVAASFDGDLAYDYGALLGEEARAYGFNAFIGGGVNLTRDPRGGRAFEYLGEDPVLAGRLMARTTCGTQDAGLPATIKHFALNDIENGRYGIDVAVDDRAMRESELLAFEIAIGESKPAIIMAAYNLVNGDYACQSSLLLNDVLKGDWGYEGWVMSDWGAVRSTVPSANAGLDQEFFAQQYFGKPLKAAVEAGEVSLDRLNDMVRRILAQMVRFGLLDRDEPKRPIDVDKGRALSRQVATEGSVLLKNDGVLPLDPGGTQSIAVIGYNADKGVVSGGGSSQVNPIGGNALPRGEPHQGAPGGFGANVWHPSAPLAAIRALAGVTRVSYDPGTDHATAAAAAGAADIAIVFAGQFRQEGADVPDLGLGHDQDALIAAIAAANPNTVVVLETGGAVLMPWVGDVQAILAVWFPGDQGGEAIADLLFAAANPSGKLPLTFPAALADLPRPDLPGPPLELKSGHIDFFEPVLSKVSYDEGSLVGYKWYNARGKDVLFPFGHGLSYTHFAHADLTVDLGDTPAAAFRLTNTGTRDGVEIAQVYVTLPASADPAPRRLAGWARVALSPGQAEQCSASLEPRALAVWDVARRCWVMPAGSYEIALAASSRDIRATTTVTLAAERVLAL